MSGGLSEKFLESFQELVEDRTSVVLGISGGGDSIGLLHLSALASRQMHIDLTVCFVDHGLRKGVEQEWELVEEQARRLGISAVQTGPTKQELEKASTTGSLQEWAREVRYRLLSTTAQRVGAGYIALGHTLDDQAETVLIRMIRGTGLDGLRGMQRSRTLGDLKVVRPMLGMERREIREYLTDRGLRWAEDPGNQNEKFLRSRVRNELLPLLESMQPGNSSRLVSLAAEIGDVTDYLAQIVEDDKRLFSLRLAKGVRLEFEQLNTVPPKAWSRLVRFALRTAAGDLRRFERRHLDLIVEVVAACKTTGRLPLPGEMAAYVSRGDLYLFPHGLPERPTGSGLPVAAGAGLWRARFAALGAMAEIRAEGPEALEGLEVRARKKGDRLFNSERKFKTVLSEGKVPVPYRNFVPVLAQGDGVISCPSLMRCRREELEVRWIFENDAPFLDIDFPMYS